MAHYVIGDVQGCADALQQLLQKIQFEPDKDTLWFVGDLVNRGPDSLGTLRFIKSLGDRAVCVLGNHDLHLLAVANGLRKDKDHDLEAILTAPDREELLNWLRHRPLLHHDPQLGYTMIHAGLAPQWDLNTAQQCAQDLEEVLRSTRYLEFFEHMYGDEPTIWSSKLNGWDRLRFICNCFTRLRYCDKRGHIALKSKESPHKRTDELRPWFEIRTQHPHEGKILFGHWSTLGIHSGNGVYALDSGCVWGGQLSALQIDCTPPQLHQVTCQAAKPVGIE